MRRATFVVTLISASLCTVIADAQPSDAGAPAVVRPLGESLTGEARTSYDIAKILYRDGDYAGALAKFRRAHELAGDPRLLWNMAACEKSLRRYPRVLDLVDRYIAEGANVLTEEDRKQAAEFRAAVRTLVADVRIEVNESGAEILVDDEVVGTSPLANAVPLSMGARRFRARKPGFIDATEQQELEGGRQVDVRLVLRPEVHEGRLVVVASAGDAIAIDGHVVSEGRFEGTLKSGPHFVEVSGTGKKRRSIDVVIRDGEQREVPITLERESSNRWPWLVAGGVALVGAVVGGYFLFRTETPGTTPGSAGTFELP